MSIVCFIEKGKYFKKFIKLKGREKLFNVLFFNIVINILGIFLCI